MAWFLIKSLTLVTSYFLIEASPKCILNFWVTVIYLHACIICVMCQDLCNSRKTYADSKKQPRCWMICYFSLSLHSTVLFTQTHLNPGGPWVLLLKRANLLTMAQYLLQMPVIRKFLQPRLPIQVLVILIIATSLIPKHHHISHLHKRCLKRGLRKYSHPTICKLRQKKVPDCNCYNTTILHPQHAHCNNSTSYNPRPAS